MKNMKLIMMILLLNTFFMSSVFSATPKAPKPPKAPKAPTEKKGKKVKKEKKKLSSQAKRNIKRKRALKRKIARKRRRALRLIRLRRANGRVTNALRSSRLEKALRFEKLFPGNDNFGSPKLNDRIARLLRAKSLTSRLLIDLKSRSAVNILKSSLKDTPKIRKKIR